MLTQELNKKVDADNLFSKADFNNHCNDTPYPHNFEILFKRDNKEIKGEYLAYKGVRFNGIYVKIGRKHHFVLYHEIILIIP